MPRLFIRVLSQVTLLAVSVLAASAQEPAPAAEPVEGSPEWVVDRFFVKKEFPDRQSYYTGEMAKLGRSRSHLGETFGNAAYRLEQFVYHRSDTSVAIDARLTHLESKAQTDYYVFLRHEEGRWKIEAMRQFVIPPGVMQMFALLADPATRRDPEALREVMLVSSFKLKDSQLESAFATKRAEFDAFAEALLASRHYEVIQGGARRSTVDKALWQKFRDLQLNYAELQQEGWIDCNLMAYTGAAVGFIWVREGVAPPVPTPDKFILMKHVEGPWYLYRRQ